MRIMKRAATLAAASLVLAGAAGLVAPAAQAVEVPFGQAAQLPLMAAEFGSYGTCPAQPAGTDGWHFVAPSGTFNRLVVTFDVDGNGTNDLTRTLNTPGAFGPPTAQHAYVYSPVGAELTSVTADVNRAKKVVLSHTCPGYALDVTKTATTTYTRTHTWTIDKSVVPPTWNLFRGDSGTSDWTVSVDKTGPVDSAWAVSGVITVANNNPMAATVTDVTDSISGVGDIAVTCPVTFPYLLAANSSFECTYSSALQDAMARTNTATATTSGAIAGDSGTAAVTFGEPTTIVGYETVNVTDTNGRIWGPVSDDASWTYPETFTCDTDEGTNTNRATITETGQYDEASVTVNCNELTVTKTAGTYYTRTWDWDIDKTAEPTEVSLAPGETAEIDYTVKVSADYTDSAWGASGDIAVHNPASIPATINSVTDKMTGGLVADVSCGVSFPYTLVGGGTLNCTYTRALEDATARTNTATATLQNYAYSSALEPTPTGTKDFTGTANVVFTAPTTVIDERICVTDDLYGPLVPNCIGVSDLNADGEYFWRYTKTVGPYDDCEEHSVVNTATFTTNDTKTTGSDSATVTVYPLCGCTYTQGYWKTHGPNDGSKLDPTWNLLNDGTHTAAGLEAILETETDGDPWLILAHQYIAATLNVLDGAGLPTAVKDDYEAATELIHSYSQGAVPDNMKAAFIAASEVLDDYNNGRLGIPHCGDEILPS